MRILRPWLASATLAAAAPLTGLHAQTHPAITPSLTLGLAQGFGDARLGVGPLLGIGVYRQATSSFSFGLELQYIGLGGETSVTPSLTPFPEFAPATASTRLSRRQLRLGLGAEFLPLGGSLKPVLLTTLGLGRYYTKYRYALSDTTGTVRATRDDSGWSTALGFSLGVGLRVPSLFGVSPTLAIQYHGVSLKGSDGWALTQFGTLGLSVRP